MGVTPHQGDDNTVYRAKKDRSGHSQASMSEEMRDATDEAQKYLEMLMSVRSAIRTFTMAHTTDGNLLKPDWRALFRETGTQGSGGDVWKSAILLVTRWASTLLWGRAAILASVLPVTLLADSGLVARCQWRPQRS